MSKRSIDEEENACSFFLERKKRRCRFKTIEGMLYCPHHSHLDIDKTSEKGKRIPCPYDSSHFCFESKLQKHLKKCNAREKEKPIYYLENMNSETTKDLNTPKVTLADINDEELISFIQRIKKLYLDLHEEITEVTSMHPILKSEMEKTDDGLNSFKHMKQQASLLSVMDESNFLKDGSCFVEFGAGKGQLMYWIVNCIPEKEKNAFILVDKSAQRHKSDSKFKGSGLPIKRLRIDIQHLHLGNVPNIQTKLNKVVGVSKHLCGGATDLAIRCMIDTLYYKKDSEKVQHKAFGLLMALCCHHRCSWNTYVGNDFMEIHGITEKDFQIMCCMASWATCGLRKISTVEDDSIKVTEPPPDQNAVNRYLKLNLSHEEREEIGMHCKRLIDAGRVHFLRKVGYNTKLITYIDKNVSLENVAILAIDKES